MVDVRMATARDFAIVGSTFHGAKFLVGGSRVGGGSDGLLGANFLNAMDVEYDLGNGVIRLFKPTGCSGQPLAYWSQDKPYSTVTMDPGPPREHKVFASASVNGVRIRVEFDSGSNLSVLTRAAAARAGVTPESAGVRAEGLTGGLGRRGIDTSVAPFQSFKIGDEDIQNTQLRLGSLELGGEVDMLLGADFFLSHRIYVANSQGKVYFTYNGGPVFRLDQAQSQTPSPPVPVANPPAGAQETAPPAGAAASPENAAAESAEEPKDAAGFGRRGSAFAARHEYLKAIDDFTRAIALEPNQPIHYYDRALARLENRQPVLAMDDLGQVLKLKPDSPRALTLRGRLRLAGKDMDGARADFEAASRTDPNADPAIADAYLSAGMFQESVDHFSAWIATHPKDEALPNMLNGRCRARAALGHDLDQALADCDQALKLRPKTSLYLDSRGLVRLKLGQIDGAIADYDGALKLQPKLAWSLYGRGLAKRKKGLSAEGDADIQAATAIAPRIADEAKRFGLTP
jgi:tetratricopeptide (TPR) repeat protein